MDFFNSVYIVPHEVRVCSYRRKDVSYTPSQVLEKRQIFDMRPHKLEVMEHKVKVKFFPVYRNLNRRDFPKEITLL